MRGIQITPSSHYFRNDRMNEQRRGPIWLRLRQEGTIMKGFPQRFSRGPTNIVTMNENGSYNAEYPIIVAARLTLPGTLMSFTAALIRLHDSACSCIESSSAI